MSGFNWLCSLTLIAWQITTCNASSLTDRSRSQFDHFFPTLEEHLRPRVLTECSEQLLNYQNYSLPDADGVREHAQHLTECIMGLLSELDKSSMAITAILLAILPIGLVNIGPSIAELGLLSTRRPVLAALLGFGAPSPNPSLALDFTDLVEGSTDVQRKWSATRKRRLSRFTLFESTPLFVKVIVSFVEYAIALGAASNCFYQMWRLTYRAVSLAPVAVYLRGLPEEATIFGWAALNLPVHLLGFATFLLAYTKPRPSGEERRRPGFYRWILNELTPCMYGEELTLKQRIGTAEVMKDTLGGFVRLLAGLHVILGTVLLGSVVFILLADALPLIYTFIASAVFTRLVLIFELEGLGTIINIDRTEPAENTEESHQMVSGK